MVTAYHMMFIYIVILGVSEVLKQVWDLSDQDNDGMLSLKEFCTALYLMERYREGCPLPTMLPSTIMPDEALFSTTSQPQAPHISGTWGPVAGKDDLMVAQSFSIICYTLPLLLIYSSVKKSKLLIRCATTSCF